mgnify:CR=1 FL=1
MCIYSKEEEIRQKNEKKYSKTHFLSNFEGSCGKFRKYKYTVENIYNNSKVSKKFQKKTYLSKLDKCSHKLYFVSKNFIKTVFSKYFFKKFKIFLWNFWPKFN